MKHAVSLKHVVFRPRAAAYCCGVIRRQHPTVVRPAA
jgi:hypothetical protein